MLRRNFLGGLAALCPTFPFLRIGKAEAATQPEQSSQPIMLYEQSAYVLNYGDGTVAYHKGFRLHREDGPALVSPNGDEYWQFNGQYHREGGPAVIEDNGKRLQWFRHGEKHREDGPAHIDSYEQRWYLNDQLHREGGPAVESPYCKTWYRYDKRHREDGPAVIKLYPDSTLQCREYLALEWMIDGNLHREDGPAVIYKRELYTGMKFESYTYLQGQLQGINYDYQPTTEELAYLEEAQKHVA